MKKYIKPLKRPSKPKNKVQKNLSHIPRKFRKMVVDDVYRYLDILGFNQYKPQIFYMKKDDDKDYIGDGSFSEKLASVIVDRRYLDLRVNIYPNFVERWKDKSFDDNDVHEAIAHEVSHVATEHMYIMATTTYKDEGEVTDARENATQIVARLAHRISNYCKK